MRVVSLVPSWTETLLACGVNVVGRTRFCVHPKDLVENIPAVGGTKDLDELRLAELRPDLLLVDREENLPWMAREAAERKVYVSHVQNTDDVPRELEELARLLSNERLSQLAQEWRAELEAPAYPRDKIVELPGVIQWLRKPALEPRQILYVIWRGPWMTVSRDTFVGSMLSHVGFGGRIPAFSEKYPKIDLGNFDPAETLLLFSSEPYPFGRKPQELTGLEFASALVDGESYSWFGIRSLRFLQGARAK